MVSNHTILTVAAFVLLTSLMLNFYRLLALSGDDISGAQDMILATTLSTSYVEVAKGLAFDEKTEGSNDALGNPSALTSSTNLGPDGSAEDSLYKFNDFDDFDGFVVEKEANGTGRRFKTRFVVNYVDQNNVQNTSSIPTFVKRMDMKTWRSFPPPPAGAKLDTLTLSCAMGYFHFD